jgi:membrane protein DedA with SNARE-associated domain
MSWPRFLFWNAAGGILWAISVGLFAFVAGHVAVRILHDAGYVVLALVAVGLLALAVWYFFRRR